MPGALCFVRFSVEMAKIDAPSWTFGLNPETPGILVPGPGTYDVAGRLVAEGVGTRFGGSRDRTNIARLVFDAGVCVTICMRNNRATSFVLSGI